MREGDKTGRVTRRERATGGERVRIETESWYT